MADRLIETGSAERLACAMLQAGAENEDIAKAIREKYAHVQASEAIKRAREVAGLVTRIRPTLADIAATAPPAIADTVQGLRSRNRIVAAAKAAPEAKVAE
jgi:hypothetical protein